MPVDPSRIGAICDHLAKIAKGERPPPIDIGELTVAQFAAINATRSARRLPTLESAALVYVGRHHYQSRSADRYTIDDMAIQLQSALSESAVVVPGGYLSSLQNKLGRDDGYGRVVKDQGILELTARKPKAEVFSVIPKGDGRQKQKAPP